MRVLTKQELIDLTDRKTRPAQATMLRYLKIDFRQRPNGDIIVIDADLPISKQSTPDTVQLNLNAA